MTAPYDLVGYAASSIVSLPLVMSSLWLRIVNLIGAATFTAYGVLIRAAPVAVVNFRIVGIDAHYLTQM